jgi:Flp pilus assembly protein TadD
LALERAVALKPDFPEAYNNLGHLLGQLGDADGAIHCYRQALRYNPKDVEVLNNLGNAYNEAGRYADALDVYLTALELRPDKANVHNNLGVVLRRIDQLQEAETCFKNALMLNPDYADAHHNLGVLYDQQGRSAEAAQSFLRSMELNPDNPALYSDLGKFLAGQKQLDQAIEAYDAALRLKPDFPAALWNRGLAYLMKGELEKGWPGHELRLMFQQYYPHRYGKPLWDGAPFACRRLLIYDEIGYGDVFQFVRYLPLVKALGGTVLFEVKPGLQRLLKGAPGIDVLLERSPLPVAEDAFDLQLPMESLPYVFETRLDTIPRNIPYLQAPPDLADLWEQRLAGAERPRIGIVWAGNPESRYDQNRSCEPRDLLPLFQLPGRSWFSLQKGEAEGQLDGLADAEKIVRLGKELGDFADTAAIIQNLDLVISVETAVPHLAGALGKPVWTLLSFLPAWRWMLDREDSPWYPTMRLFRQSQPGDWSDVVARVAAALRAWRIEGGSPPN